MTMKIAAKPRDIATCVAGYLKDGDLEGVVSMFHPACQIFFPADAPPSIGHDGARAVFKDFVPMRPTLDSTVTSEIINGDTALLQADWRFKEADGNVIAEGQSTEVAKKLANGGWGYFIDCPDGPPSK
ncbi:nuclear transport factor 2 family protein [Yoonia sp. SS1-5]|uniref:Nuclear transport factor 2 family protein n=1 Tax=Yoonia rhodophyticola TaxID=3137370 RepID=A0AAN0M935_9RHOB